MGHVQTAYGACTGLSALEGSHSEQADTRQKDCLKVQNVQVSLNVVTQLLHFTRGALLWIRVQLLVLPLVQLLTSTALL